MLATNKITTEQAIASLIQEEKRDFEDTIKEEIEAVNKKFDEQREKEKKEIIESYNRDIKEFEGKPLL